MKSGAIPDSAITASQSQIGYGPEHARLGNPQGWYTQERQTSQDYLQIDTGSVHYITKIATQVIMLLSVSSTVLSTRQSLQKICASITLQQHRLKGIIIM